VVKLMNRPASWILQLALQLTVPLFSLPEQFMQVGDT
jgi:hypothetical protein